MYNDVARGDAGRRATRREAMCAETACEMMRARMNDVLCDYEPRARAFI